MNLRNIEKTSSSRSRKEIVSFLLKKGLNKKTVRNASPTKLKRLLAKAKAPKFLQNLASEEISARAKFSSMVDKSVGERFSPEEAARFRSAAKRHWSGAHLYKPRKGEEFIEAFGTPEIAMSKADQKYLWRGNPLRAKRYPITAFPRLPPRINNKNLIRKVNFFSRHPDVAAAYAEQGTRQLTGPTRRLFRYTPSKGIKDRSITGATVRVNPMLGWDRKGKRFLSVKEVLKNLREKAVKGGPMPRTERRMKLNEMEELVGYERKLLSKANLGGYGTNPTYETALIPDTKTKALLGEPTEFTVRKSRTKDGRIGFAIKPKVK